jgi:tripartite-type tricarboxylate transporter receptor subunit TctC
MRSYVGCGTSSRRHGDAAGAPACDASPAPAGWRSARCRPDRARDAEDRPARGPSRIGRRGLLAALAPAPLAAARPARAAEPWPVRPATIVVPFAPGGSLDILARVIARGVQARTGIPVVVDNRAGAQGNIGIESVRRSAPDGHTLVVLPSGNLTINPTLIANLPFDVQRDFAAIRMLASTANVVVCGPALPVRDLQSMIAYVRARADGATFGSAGIGQPAHLAGELLAQRAGIRLLHVPYRGTSPGLADVISGQVQFFITNLPAVLPSIQAGSLRAVALTTAARAPAAPDIPTLEELGMPDFDVGAWYGLLAPRATRAAVLGAVEAEVSHVMAAPQTREALAAQALTVVDERGAAFEERIRRETATWAELIRSRGIRSGLEPS